MSTMPNILFLVLFAFTISVGRLITWCLFRSHCACGGAGLKQGQYNKKCKTLFTSHKTNLINNIVCTAQTQCPDGYEGHLDFCYKLLPVKASWGTAQHYCEAVGGSLVVIEDAAENTFIQSMLNRIHSEIQTDQIWIGGTDLLQEGTWIAPKTLLPLPYLNWSPGQPDNSKGEHCLALFNSPPTFPWDDSWCENAKNPLCKRSKVTDTEIVG